MPRVTDLLEQQELIEPSPQRSSASTVGDLTREPLTFPPARDVRLQSLARAMKASSSASATRRSAATRARILSRARSALARSRLSSFAEELGFAVPLGSHQLDRVPDGHAVQGLGQKRRRNSLAATASPSVNPSANPWRWLSSTGRCARENWARMSSPPPKTRSSCSSHADNVEAMGFVEHLKLPHYVDFQAELQLVRQMRAEHAGRGKQAAATSRRPPNERRHGLQLRVPR